MGTILFSALIVNARKISFDMTSTPRHTDDQYLTWGNAGQRQMAIYKPDVSVVNQLVVPVAGTKQDVPAGCTVFIKLIRNMGTDGNAPGRTIEFEDFSKFSKFNPWWHTADALPQVRFYLYDPKDPKHYYTFPPWPAAGGEQVEGVFATAPTDIADVENPISVDDIYANALEDYLLYRVFTVEAAINPYAVAKSQAHWNQFVTALGRMDLVKAVNSPKEDKDDGR